MLVCVCGIYFLLDLHFLKIITVYIRAENTADSDAVLIKTALLRVVFIKMASGQGDSSHQRVIKQYTMLVFRKHSILPSWPCPALSILFSPASDPLHP